MWIFRLPNPNISSVKYQNIERAFDFFRNLVAKLDIIHLIWLKGIFFRLPVQLSSRAWIFPCLLF